MDAVNAILGAVFASICLIGLIVFIFWGTNS